MPIVIDISGPTTEEELAQAVAEATSEADAAAAGAAASEANALAYKNAAQELFDNISTETLEAVAQITTNYEQAVADFDDARDSGLSQIDTAKNDALDAITPQVTTATDAAASAQTDSEAAVAARQGAESARGDAQSARNDAQAFKNTAGTSATNASNAAQDALSYSQTASTARNEAVSANEAAAGAATTATEKAAAAAASAATVSLGQPGGVATLNTAKARLKARFLNTPTPDGRTRDFLLSQAIAQAAISNAQPLYGIAENPKTGRIAAVGSGGTGECVYYSDDAFATAPTAKATPDDTMGWRGICFLSWLDRWLINATSGTGNRMCYSNDDLATITQVASPDDLKSWNGFVVVEEKQLVYMFGGSGGTVSRVQVSSDGLTWADCPISGSSGITYRGGCYVAHSETVLFVGSNGGGHCAARLTDFTTHTVTTVASSNDAFSWRDVVEAPWLGDGAAIAVSEATSGAGNKAMKTLDAGQNWTGMATADDSKGYRGLVSIPELGMVMTQTRATASLSYSQGITWGTIATPAGLDAQASIWSSVRKRMIGVSATASATNKYVQVSAPIAITAADLAGKIDTTKINAANGVAPTDADNRVPYANMARYYFDTRAAFVAAGITPSDGTVVSAAGYRYKRVTGATALSGLNDWMPVGPDTPQHHGALGDGANDDSDAVENCLKSGRPVEMGYVGTVYKCTRAIAATQTVDCEWTSHGALIQLSAAATIIARFVKLTSTNQNLRMPGWWRFDANNRAFRGYEIQNTPTSFDYGLHIGKIEVFNTYRSSTAFTGGDGLYIACGYRSVVIDELYVNGVKMARGAGIAGSQGVTGYTITAISSTMAPRLILLGCADVENVFSEDRWYTADQDGGKVFTANDSATDKLPWPTQMIILSGSARNCRGRAIKSQCEMGTVSNLSVFRDTGGLDTVTLTLTGSPAGNTSGVLTSAWFGNSTTTGSIVWSDGTRAEGVTLTYNSTAISWTGAAPVGATATILFGGMGLTLTGALVAASSGTLNKAFGGVTSKKYTATFSDGSVRTGISLTNGSTAISWTDEGGGAVTASATLTEVGIPVVGGFEIDFQVGGGSANDCNFEYRNWLPWGLFSSTGTSETGSINRISSAGSAKGFKCWASGPSLGKMTQPFRLRRQKAEGYKPVVSDIEINTDPGVSIADSLAYLTSSAAGEVGMSVSHTTAALTASLVDISASGSNTRLNVSLDLQDNTNLTFVSATLTGVPGGNTSGTLTGNFTGGPSDSSYTVQFSDGSTRSATLTNGGTAISWLGAANAGVTTAIVISGPLLTASVPLTTNTPPPTNAGVAVLNLVNAWGNPGYVNGGSVQQSVEDATAGRQLLVGAFGLGGSNITNLTAAGALDNVAVTAFNRAQGANIPTINGPSGASSGVALTVAYNATSGVQLYWEMVAPYRSYRRSKNASVWGSWVMDPLMGYADFATPEAHVTAPPGSLLTTSAGALYIKTSGTGNTGWVLQ